jgi:lipopolysaccharide transport system permease protein
MHFLTALWHYRHFIASSIRSELKGRFARSKLGALWFILHPLAQAAIYSLVLSEFLAARLPGTALPGAYGVYLMAGLAAWTLFSEIATRCTTIFIDHANALKKIAFPRLCLPAIVGGGALVNQLLLLGAIAVVTSLLGRPPTVAWLALLPGIALVALLAFGLGVLLGTFNVFVRDVGQVFGVVIQIWFWLTPVVYPRDTIPQGWRWINDINPMTPLVRLYQDVILFGAFPDWRALIPTALVAIALLVVAFTIFRRASADLVDAL